MEEYEGMIRFVKVDIDLYPDLAEKYEIQSVPTLLFFNGKELVRRESGFMPASEIINIIETEFFDSNLLKNENNFLKNESNLIKGVLK